MPSTEKLPVELGPVQSTLLIPLWGRAEQTRKQTGLIDDPMAVEIVQRLDYDFSKWRGTTTSLGAVLRTRMFDQDVAAFLEEHPEGTVVELGCGLNTRFERLDNERANWIEVDLPDVIELRRRFFEQSPRRRMLAADITGPDWLNDLGSPTEPICFVSEATLLYLDPEDALAVLSSLADRFREATLILDTSPRSLVEQQHRHDTLKHLPRESWFRWSCEDPSELEQYAWKLTRSRSLLDADRSLVKSLPRTWRFAAKFLKPLLQRRLNGYRFNVFRSAFSSRAPTSSLR